MYNAIGAHIYAGGFTVGMARHFNVLAHLEHAAYGKDVVQMNFPGLPIYDGGPANWPKSWPTGKARPRFLYANPPCAIWSTASSGRACEWRDDPRLAYHHDIFHYALDEVGVDVLSIESVPPSFTKGREHVDNLIEMARERGYSSTVVMEDAMYLDVAQSRRRIFYTFHKIAIPWECPDFSRVPTVREVLKGIKPGWKKGFGYDPKMPDRLAALAERIGPGAKLKDAYDELYPDPPRSARGFAVGRPSFLEARAPWDKPAPVVIAGKMIHPQETRYMAQEELAAICSFPPDYKWPKGNFTDVSGYMSRGVMPNVGAWLGANVLAGIEENRRINDPVATVLDVSKPPGVVYDLLPAPVFQVRLPAPEETGEEDPVTATPARPRALLTGTTAVQVGSQRTELKIISSASAWKAVLEDLGYDVDWRPVTPGEEVEDYAAVIVVLGKPNSIAASHFYGCLWTLLERDDAIIAVDDWQTQELLGGIQTYARSEERAFKLHGTKFSPEMREALFDGLKLMADEPWMWPVIAHTLGKGDASLLGLPASVVQVDPTSYTLRYPAVPGKRKKGWVLASLLDRPAPEGVKWPVANYGRKENRVTEPELMKIYSEAWGVLSPPHAHAGSGWWRVRYLMAADAGCVISADIREAQGLGQPYVEASDPRYVERLSLPQLEDLARRQAECLKSIAWSKTKVKNAIRSLIAGAKDVAKPTPVTPGKRPAPVPAAAVGSLPRRNENEGSGVYIQRLLQLGFQAPEILAAVHEQFPGSKAGPSDVSYNRNKLKQAGWTPGGSVVVATVTRPATARLPDKQPKYAVPESRGEEAPPWKENAADLSFATIRGKVATARRVGDKRTVQKFADAITAFLYELEGI